MKKIYSLFFIVALLLVNVNSNLLAQSCNGNGGTIDSDQTIASGSAPNAFTNTFSATGQGLAYYYWQASVDNSSFTTIAGAISSTYLSVALNVTTYFRRKVTDSPTDGGGVNICFSNTITVTVNASQCSIGSNQTISYGGDPTAFTGSVISGDCYRWLSSAGGPYAVISGATALTYDVPAGLTTTTNYRRENYNCQTTTTNCTSNQITITVTPPPGGIIGTSQTICSGGNPANFTGSNVTGSSYTWQSSTDSTNWTQNISGATSLDYDAPNGLNLTTYYRRGAMPQTGGPTNYSNVIKVTVNFVNVGIIAAPQTICNGGDPAAFTQPGNFNCPGTPSFEWKHSTDNYGSVLATTSLYDVPTGLTATTSYRRIITSTLGGLACAAPNTDIVITVQSAVTGGTIASSQTICNGGDPAAFTESVASTGSGTLTYEWSVAQNGAPILATTKEYDVNTALTATTTYGRKTISTLGAVACADVSNYIMVTVQPAVTGGTIASSQTICNGGDPAAFTESVASTGSGTLTYQWKYSTDGYSATLGTGTSYNVSSGLTSTTTYKRITFSITGSAACTANSNDIIVTVTAAVAGGTIASSQTICNGGDPAAFTDTGFTGTGTTYQWKHSADSYATPLATTATYDVSSGLTATTTYRRITTSTLNGVTCTGNSNDITVTVQSAVTGGTIASSQAICNGDDPAAFTESVASTGSGTLSYQWKHSADNYTATLGTSSTYDVTSGLTATTAYRKITTSNLGGNLCTAASNDITVTVNNVSPGSINGGNITICSGTSHTITNAATANGTGTISYQWQSSPDYTNFTDINNTNTPSYTTPNLTQFTYYRRIAKSTLNGVGCSVVSNNIVSITVYHGGTIENAQTICIGGDPFGFTENSAAYSIPASYQWQSATDNNFANITTNGFGITYDAPGNLTTTTKYRRVSNFTQTGLSCFSNEITVEVNSAIIGDTLFCVGDLQNFSLPQHLNNNYLSWNFGDGSSQNGYGNSVYHSYNEPGNYTITVNFVNGSCSPISKIVTSSTNSTTAPHPSIQALNSPTCPGDPIKFSTEYYSTYKWDFDTAVPNNSGNDTSLFSNPQHQYAIGLHTVKLQVKNQCGISGEAFTQIQSSDTAPWPEPSSQYIIYGPSYICPNSNVYFNAPAGFPEYEWDFGDGSATVVSTNDYISHFYGSGFTFATITLHIKRACGNPKVIQTSISKVNSLPISLNNQPLLFPSSSCPNSFVNFQAAHGYFNYKWYFGDGTDTVTTNNNSVNHFYSDSLGNKNVSVTFSNACGNTASQIGTISINSSAPFPNNMNLEIQTSPACAADNIYFRAPQGYQNYQWFFGDGGPPVNTSQYDNFHIYASDGMYSAKVIITNGCGNKDSIIKSVTISNTAGFPNNSQFMLHLQSPACPGSFVGMNAPGGYQSYEWTFGDGAANITTTSNYFNHTYNTIGTYPVSVKIKNGCGAFKTLVAQLEIKDSVSFPIDENFKLTAQPAASCPGDEVNIFAPHGYVNYLWMFSNDTLSGSQNHVQHIFDTPGTFSYSCTITNACGSSTTLNGSITVDNASGGFFAGLAIEANPSTSTCINDLVHFTLNQNSFSSYKWNFGDGDSLITQGNTIQHDYNSLGVKNVTCQVQNGCGNYKTLHTTIQVNATNPVDNNLTITGIQNPSCIGDNVQFIIQDGQPSNQYIWDFGDNSAPDTTIGIGLDHIYTVNDTFTINVTVKNSCGGEKTLTLTQFVKSNAVPSLTLQNGDKSWGSPNSNYDNGLSYACVGDAVVFYFFGDAASNLWNFGDGSTGIATESSIYNVGSGTYPITTIKHVYATNGTYNVSLTLTNNCGNSVTDSLKIIIGGSNLLVSGDMVASPPPYTTCAAIDFAAFGGSSYVWYFGDGDTLSSPSPTATHTYAIQGAYVATVKVINGCGNSASYSKAINVTSSAGLSLLSISHTPSCIGGTDGSATIHSSNGIAPFTYLWSDGIHQIADSAYSLNRGVYTATVTDKNGCSASQQVIIQDPAALVLSMTMTPSTCGSFNGKAFVNVVSGPSGPYTYQWTSGGTNDTVVGLAYGLHGVTVFYGNQCEASSNIAVCEASGVPLTLLSAANNDCYGANTGYININISTNPSNLIYLWSNGATTKNISNLAAGNYTLETTNPSNNCHLSFTHTITQPAILDATFITVKSPTCGNSDGAISATVSGGTAPYTYVWTGINIPNGTNVINDTVSGLAVDSYTLTITDAKLCTAVKTFALSNVNSPLVTAVINPVSCFGLSDGSIDITVNEGTSPYTYTWSVAPFSEQDIDSLPKGLYVIFVEDAMHCKAIRIYSIEQPDVLSATITSESATCQSSNGTATANPIGGNGGYSYFWTGGLNISSKTTTGLAVGTYAVTVSDSILCSTSASVTIAQVTPTPKICLVTINETFDHNVIVWEKSDSSGPYYNNIHHFNIYREVSTNIYKVIGSMPYDSLSEFVDPIFHVDNDTNTANGDPNVGAYRYKLQMVDICGDSSNLSLYHNTIYIAGPDSAGNFDWNLPYAIEGSDPNIANYILMCDTTQNNSTGWYSVGAVAGTQANVADPGYVNHQDAQWFVKTDWTTECTATRAQINTSRSNKRPKGSLIIENIIKILPEGEIVVYPNPARNTVTIEFSTTTEKTQLRIINVLGQMVFNEFILAGSGKTIKQINTSAFTKGVYSVIVDNNKNKVVKKLIIN